MNIQEMRQLTLDDLKAQRVDLRTEYFNLKFRLTTQPLDNPLHIRRVRRDIARVETLIREKATPATHGQTPPGEG
ncbi:MAG: 50S ribosomal protein L29 [Gemmatimonadota bacterium]|jgi:large subunit ribosomal protein L29|nr:50S ribosomal protein L29 [Gemmatimonadota bacterium]MDP6530042.1 50S ribosomal protein L29 [Gemmatimonadota bacterium]MDP6803411.1 50S ribosomal protein L29 [Gemmatimonadota bacterium]MDP7032380.1 50S ribosomal protein L29 [Gemmatimonadota bacterium]